MPQRSKSDTAKLVSRAGAWFIEDPSAHGEKGKIVSVSERAVAITELERDKIAREKAEQFIKAIGASATRQAFESIPYEAESVTPIESLYDAIQGAAEGNEAAREMVKTNAKTDVVERTIKSGHVTEIFMSVDEIGTIQQYGQSLESIQENSLRLAASNPKMRRRVIAETNNAFRLKQEYARGTLKDHSFVVFSCAADNMTSAEAEKAGFFTDTMSCAIQVTTEKDGELSIESAFVAGVKRPGGPRVDIDTVVAIAEKLRANLQGKNATEILNTPLLVPNHLIKNGAVDLVRLWDELTGDTFFGEAREKQDYLEYRKKCEEREQMLQPKVELIVQELIDEAPHIHDRLEASRRLHKISGKHMVQQAIFDTAINPKVFGPVSAAAIFEARMHFEQGNTEQGFEQVNFAIKNEQSNSCPGGVSGGSSEQQGNHSDNEKTCTFVSKKCPKCDKANVLTTVTATRISGSCGCVKRLK